MMRNIFVFSCALLFATGVVAQHTSEQAEAAISGVFFKYKISELQCSKIHFADPSAECTVYGYQPVTNALSSFPPIWKNASILPSDTVAAAKWASFQADIPNIPPKVRLQPSYRLQGCDDDP